MPTPVGISARSCCWARGGPARVRWAQSGSRSSRAALDVIGLCRLRQRECLATKALPERDRHNPKVGIIAVNAQHREREPGAQADQGLEDPFLGLVAHRPGSVQPVKTCVTVRVWANSPRGSPPSWPTRSISTNPGACSSQSAQVRIEIWDFNRLPGLVPERPLSSKRLRSQASRRSIVAADIAHSIDAVASSRSSSRKARNRPTISGRNGAILLPAEASITAHTLRSATITGERTRTVRYC